MSIFKSNEKFFTGNEAVVAAAIKADAKLMSGYPITPATEILEDWIKECEASDGKMHYIQSEDEIAAGFNVLGGILAGAKSFTATAGVGHILMQDSIAMAEAMRLPFVGIIMQRGGPSTGTVIYSQQEVTLATNGANGEGLRVVYSTSNPQELYNYTIKAFNTAWKYRFPTFVLGDGYQSKMRTGVKIEDISNINSVPIVNFNKPVNLRNCYNFENELHDELNKNIKDFEKVSHEISEWEEYKCGDAETIIFAHGIVSGSAKEAVDILRSVHNKKVGLFRPITLKPFPVLAATKITSKVHKILIVESSNGHFARIVKENLYAMVKIDILFKPVESIEPNEIVDKIKKIENFWTEH